MHFKTSEQGVLGLAKRGMIEGEEREKERERARAHERGRKRVRESWQNGFD